MKGKIEIILQHGWGFDKTCWRGWMPHLKENQDCEISIQTPDRGYFGDRTGVLPFQNRDSVKVIVVHSLGLHLLPIEILQSCDLLVIAASFSHFHSGSPLEHRRSRRRISALAKRLTECPLETLNDFYSECYHPLLTSQMLLMRNTQSVVADLLEEDLEILSSSNFDMLQLRNVPKILFLHGSEDAVVPASHSHQMSAELPQSDLIVFEGAGHSLPLTHVAPAWISLRSKLRHLLSVSAK